MTEQQDKLMPYISHMAYKIIDTKEKSCVVPLGASSVEILTDIHEDAIECMRELYRKGEFIGSNTINHPMLLRKDKKNDIR